MTCPPRCSRPLDVKPMTDVAEIVAQALEPLTEAVDSAA